MWSQRSASAMMYVSRLGLGLGRRLDGRSGRVDVLELHPFLQPNATFLNYTHPTRVALRCLGGSMVDCTMSGGRGGDGDGDGGNADREGLGCFC